MYMVDIKLYIRKKWKRTGDPDTKFRIYSKGLGMEFSFEKCAMLIMKSGKRGKN